MAHKHTQLLAAENMITSFDMMQPSEAADSMSAALSSGMHMQSRLKTGWQTLFVAIHRSTHLACIARSPCWHAHYASFAAMRIPMHGYIRMVQAAGQATMQAVIEPAD